MDDFLPKPNLISLSDIVSVFSSLKSPLTLIVVCIIIGAGIVTCGLACYVDGHKRVRFCYQYHPLPPPGKRLSSRFIFGDVKVVSDGSWWGGRKRTLPGTDFTDFDPSHPQKDSENLDELFKSARVAPDSGLGSTSDNRDVLVDIDGQQAGPSAAEQPNGDIGNCPSMVGDLVSKHAHRPLATVPHTRPPIQIALVQEILLKHNYCSIFCHRPSDQFTGPQRATVATAVLLTALVLEAFWFSGIGNANTPLINQFIQALIVTIFGTFCIAPLSIIVRFLFVKSKVPFPPPLTYPQPKAPELLKTLKLPPSSRSNSLNSEHLPVKRAEFRRRLTSALSSRRSSMNDMVDPAPTPAVMLNAELHEIEEEEHQTTKSQTNSRRSSVVSFSFDAFRFGHDFINRTEEEARQKRHHQQEVSEQVASVLSWTSPATLCEVADATSRAANPVAGVHAKALMTALAGNDLWAAKLEGQEEDENLDQLWEAALLWLEGHWNNPDSKRPPKPKLTPSQKPSLTEDIVWEPAAFYFVVLLALHLRLYVLAVFLLRYGLTQSEAEYELFASHSALLSATVWLCEKFQEYLFQLVPYTEEDRQYRTDCVRRLNEELELTSEGWTGTDYVFHCECVDGGCRSEALSGSAPGTLSHCLRAVNSQIEEQRPDEQKAVVSFPASQGPGLSTTEMGAFAPTSSPLLPLCQLCGTEKSSVAVRLTEGVAKVVARPEMVEVRTLSFEDTVAAIRQFEYYKALQGLCLSFDSDEGFTRTLPARLAAFFTTTNVTQYTPPFLLLMFVLYLQGSDARLDCFEKVYEEIQHTQHLAAQRQLRRRQRQSCIELIGMSGYFEKRAVEKNPIQSLEMLFKQKEYTDRVANHNTVLVQLYNLAQGAADTLFVRSPNCEIAYPDDYGDGSLANPFGSIYMALACVRHGQRIMLLPGTYPPVVLVDIHGSPELPISIQGASADGVLIEGLAKFELTGKKKPFMGPLIGIKNCRFLSLSHLHLVDGSVGVVLEPDCVYVTLSHLHIASVQQMVQSPDKVPHCIHLEEVVGEGIDPNCFQRFENLELTPKLKYVAFVLALAWMVVCVFLALAYGNMFSDKTNGSKLVAAWIISFVISFVIDFLIVDPLIIFLTGHVFSGHFAVSQALQATAQALA